MISKSRTPQIRFKGFSGEWEEKKLIDEVELFSGLTYSPNDVIKNGGTLVLRSSNVKKGQIVDADNVYVNSDVVNCDNVQKGDIAIVVRNGSRSLIGKHAQIQEEMKNTVIGAFMTGLHSKRPSYINALLDTTNFYKEIDKNLGATINQITNGAFRQMLFSFAKPDEQTKIGNYFQNLDKLIEQKDKKYQKLKQFKKAMLDKMFPKNGANTPEVRFKGFSGQWEEKKLGNIYDFQYGQFNTNPSDGGIYPIYGANGIIGGYSKFNTENSVVIGHMGENAGSVLWEEGKHFVTYNGTISTPKSSQFNPNYGYYMLYNLNIKKMCAGSGQPFLSYETLQNLAVSFSLLTIEQTKIGNYFQKLDNLIDLQQQELEKLKNIKKASLDKMFV